MNWDEWPEGADHKRLYLGWSLLKSKDEAAAIFAERYGRPPEFVFATSDGILRAGPVPEAARERLGVRNASTN